MLPVSFCSEHLILMRCKLMPLDITNTIPSTK